MHCAQCLPPVFSIFPSQFIGPVRLRRVCSLRRDSSKKVTRGYRFGRVFELRCSCKISILDFVLYLVRLCAFHFSSFSICIVHQQLRWRWSCHSRCGLHWAGRLQCLPFWFCSSRLELGTGYCSLVGLMFLPKCISIRHISHASLPSPARPAMYIVHACIGLCTPLHIEASLGASAQPSCKSNPSSSPTPRSWLMCHVQCNALLSNQTGELTLMKRDGFKAMLRCVFRLQLTSLWPISFASRGLLYPMHINTD